MKFCGFFHPGSLPLLGCSGQPVVNNYVPDASSLVSPLFLAYFQLVPDSALLSPTLYLPFSLGPAFDFGPLSRLWDCCTAALKGITHLSRLQIQMLT